MPERAILAIEEALLSSLFTLRGLVELLVKKGIIERHELEAEILQSESVSVGAGRKKKRVFLEKRSGKKRRTAKSKIKKERRTRQRRKNIS